MKEENDGGKAGTPHGSVPLRARREVSELRAGTGKKYEFSDDSVELLNERVHSGFAEGFHEGTVIPESSIFLSIESLEDAITSAGMNAMMRGIWWIASCSRSPMCACASQTSIGSPR